MVLKSVDNDGKDATMIGRKLECLLHAIGKGRSRLSIVVEQGAVFLFLVLLTSGTCFLARHFHAGEPTVLGVLSICSFACSFIVLLGWFLYLVHPWFRQWWVRVSCGSALFVWGFATFFYFPVDTADADDFTARILRATNRTSMTMFAKGRAYGKPLSLPARVNYGAFQTALIFYVAAVLFSLFGRTAMNSLQKLFVWNEDLLHVFWGLSERDRLLARSIHSANSDARIEFNLPKSVMYDTLELARLTDLADELRAFWMFVNLQLTRVSKVNDSLSVRQFLCSKLSDWFAPSVVKGRHHYFLDDDGHANMAMAQRLADVVMEDDDIYGKWHFFVRAGDIDNEGLFTSWAEGLYEKTGHMVEVSIVRDAELVARDFVAQYPPISAPCLKLDPDSATVDGVCRTLLLGFDRVGRELLNVNLCISGFVGVDGESVVQFPFTVVDMKKERWERYLLSVPEIASRKEEYGLCFEQKQVGMREFESWFRQKHCSFDRIVFCMSDDAVNIRECLRVSDILKEEFHKNAIELFVRIKNPRLADLLSLDVVSNTNVVIRTFGDISRLYSYNAFHADEIDKLAAAMNWRWNLLSESASHDVIQSIGDGKLLRSDLQDDILRYWSGAGMYNRRSSQVLALRCLTFCYIWGIRLAPDANGRLALVGGENGCHRISYDDFREKIALGRHRRVLARMEHQRWSTYMRVSGYRSFDDAQDSLRELQAQDAFVLNQIKYSRRHAGLVDFDPNCEELVCKCEMGWRVLADAAAVADLCEPPKVDDANGGVDIEVSNGAKKPDHSLSEYANQALLRQCAIYADIYPRSKKTCDGSKSLSAEEFLKSDEIYKLKEIQTANGIRDVFWFEDVISPHFDFRRRRQFKTRYAFVYERDSGMIRPLDVYPRDFRRQVVGELGIKERLVDFSTQPHFIARVTREMLTCEDKQSLSVVLSYCGTERFSRKDWLENVMQCFGFTPPQFRLAASLLKAVCETYSSEDVYVVGHSEGGGEVQYSLMRNAAWRWCGSCRKVRGFTFNSQRLSPRILHELEYERIRQRVSRMIVNVRIESDIVSGCRKLGAGLIGSVFNFNDIPGPSYNHSLNFIQACKTRVKAHSLKNIIEEIDNSIPPETNKAT